MTPPPAQVAEQIGDLLIRTGVLTPELLADAVKLSEKMGVSLGRTFEANGYMTERSVDTAIQLKLKVDVGELSLDDAVQAMSLIAHQGVDLETALRQMKKGLFGEHKIANKLGELLCECGIISPQQLSNGLYDSLNTGLPLGMVLAEKDVVPPLVLEWALTAQRMVRDGHLTHEQAAQGLRAARLRGTSFQASLQDHRFPTSGLKNEFGIGELLVLANIITETQLLAARETELLKGLKVEEVLRQWHLAADDVLEAAKQLLNMVLEGAIFEDQAATIVRKLGRCRNREEMMQILNNLQAEVETGVPAVDLMDLIIACRLLQAEQLEAAEAIAQKNNAPLLQVILQGGFMARELVNATNECKRCIESGAIEPGQAMIALTYTAEHQIPFAQSLTRFGWDRMLANAMR